MSVCAFCGSAACDLHHPTGKDADNEYLDPDLRIPVCHNDHELIHDDWHTLGLHDALPGLSRLELIELGLRRLAIATSRFAEAHPDWSWAAGIAVAFGRWADELAAELRARDARDPGWRQDPAFYPTGERTA
jgi:hypothetical protein